MHGGAAVQNASATVDFPPLWMHEGAMEPPPMWGLRIACRDRLLVGDGAVKRCVLLGLFFVIACGGSSNGTSSASGSAAVSTNSEEPAVASTGGEEPVVEAGPVAAVEPAEVRPPGEHHTEVLDFGAEPRRRLRYQVPAGTRRVLRMHQAMQMILELGGNPVNVEFTTIMDVAMEVAELRADGSMMIDYSFIAARVEAAPDVVSRTQPIMDAMLGIRGSSHMSERGQVLWVEFDLSAIPEPLQQQLQPMLDGLKQMNVVLPVEPVGAGARWVNVSQMQTQVRFEMRATYELQALQGDQLSVALQVRQAGPPQVAGEGAGAISIEHFAGAGAGTAEWNLSTLATSSQSTVSVESRGRAQANGMPINTTVRMVTETVTVE